jgi:hypothetical protein
MDRFGNREGSIAVEPADRKRCFPVRAKPGSRAFKKEVRLDFFY